MPDGVLHAVPEFAPVPDVLFMKVNDDHVIVKRKLPLQRLYLASRSRFGQIHMHRLNLDNVLISEYL